MNTQIDRLVAVMVMKWELGYTVGYPEPHTMAYVDEFGATHRGFSPTSNIEDAWKALDKVCEEHNWRAMIDRNQNQTEVSFKTQMGADSNVYGIAETPMMAICEAVLDSVGIKMKEELK